MSVIQCFKAYDVRGRVPDELDAGIAYRIARGFVAHLGARRVVIGRDIRHSSPEIADAVARGIVEGGADALEIGICGTEEVYFATFSEGLDGGLMVTASHNPPDYNGLKMVREGARPLSGDSGLPEIRRLAETGDFSAPQATGERRPLAIRDAYVRAVHGDIDLTAVASVKMVTNAGNGCAGPAFDALARDLPLDVVRLHHEPDGDFPNGVPNPMLAENRAETAERVRTEGADLGVAWDGDFDRCFFFDETGRFVDGYYIVGLLARVFCEREAGAPIIYDPRLTWNTEEIVRSCGGQPVLSKAGHAFIKARMREVDAVFGGEVSAHYYFRTFGYCDSGMLPWLVVLELMGRTGAPLSQLVDERMARYPSSGEINRELSDPAGALERVAERYGQDALAVDRTDGLSVELRDWRFNIRPSNTEPVVRLNVEARGDRSLMEAKTEELLGFLSEL